MTASALLRTGFLAFVVSLGWLVPGFAHAGYEPLATWLQRHDDLHVRSFECIRQKLSIWSLFRPIYDTT